MNARWNARGRALLIERVLGGRPAAHLAKEVGISRQFAYRWVRSAALSLFADTTSTAGSRAAGGFLLAVARGRPTRMAAVRVQMPWAVSSR